MQANVAERYMRRTQNARHLRIRIPPLALAWTSPKTVRRTFRLMVGPSLDKRQTGVRFSQGARNAPVERSGAALTRLQRGFDSLLGHQQQVMTYR